ncbi:Ig-like domain-containing protein [Acinetobacter beijerinckii]|uniref:Ig-like domain-containing protein n=1 Tax=Acinetobacter beijerinckii TaxID=262668 RepID=UPI002405A8D2|nr:Ig-like domain-containing protein [Acinetobacter beijerinckii]
MSMNKKQLTLKLSAIAVSVLLASCGGGGGGYYGSNNNSTDSGGGTPGGGTTTNPTAAGLKIELDKLSMAATNGQLTVTVRALDANKGGVSTIPVTLSIIDSTNNVNNASVSKQTTNESGNAVFVLTTPSTSATISELIKNGFKIVVTANDGKLSQEQVVTVTGADTSTGADTTSIVLFDATKTSLNVRGDQTTVTLTAVDANGATLSNQAISLKVKNSALNGVKFTPNATQTDANGRITYTLSFTEAQRSSTYSSSSFIVDDLILEANFGQSTKIYSYKLDVVNSTVPQPVGAISVAYNPTKIESSVNGVYYYQNVSVQVTDVDGKPIPNQDVIMGVNALTYNKGSYAFFDTNTPPDGTADKYLPYVITQCVTPVVKVNSNGKEIDQLKPVKDGQTVQVVSFINSEGTPATDNKYTTDANGRFDLKVQYPKIYAGYLNIQLIADSIVSGKSISGSTSFGLSYLVSDVVVADGIAPNIESPYGLSTNCLDGL